MVRQTSKRPSPNSEHNQDLLFLLSCIRSRQNALIFFLELFAMASCQKLSPQQYSVYKQEFLQKQKINSQQVRILVQKLTVTQPSTTQVKTFWMKLKSIVRVSAERARTLGMLTASLEQCYEYIVQSIDSFYGTGSNIKEYMLIQQLVKRRTIEALIATKHLLLDQPIQDFSKIRSQTFLKGPVKPAQTLSYSPSHRKEKQLGSLQQIDVIKQQIKQRRKDKKGKPLDCKRYLRPDRVNLILGRSDRNLMGVMQLKVDSNFGKKKGNPQIENILYDAIFTRNIVNHKIIAKHVHNCSKMAHKLMPPQRRNFSQPKLTKKLIPDNESSQMVKGATAKVKLTRPKTSKNTAKKTTNHPKGTSMRTTEKIYDLIRQL